MDLDEIRNAQLGSEDLQVIINCIKSNKWEECNTNSVLRAFSALQDELYLDNNVIFRQLSDEHCQVILPPTLHPKILMMYLTQLLADILAWIVLLKAFNNCSIGQTCTVSLPITSQSVLPVKDLKMQRRILLLSCNRLLVINRGN